MRARFTPVLVGACLLGPGCSFFHNVKLNMINEPCLAVTEKLTIKRHQRLARLAWDEMVAQYGCQFSDDYRDGFIDGFVDYLTFGGCTGDGCGEGPVIPAVPPPQYRKAKAMSPEGLRGAEDWFMGFRHGSNTAMASGLRQLVVIPVFDRPVPSSEEVPGRFRAMTGGSGSGAATPSQLPSPTPVPADGEALPPPRPVPPEDADKKPPAGPPAPPANPTPPAGPAAPPG